MKREDLKAYKSNQEWINARFDYIEELRTVIEKITSVISDMPKGSRKVNDNMAEKIALLQDNLSELMNRILIADTKQKEILKQLDKVEQPYKTILDKVYIQGKSLVKVADEMSYSYVHICREHGVALNKFDEIK